MSTSVQSEVPSGKNSYKSAKLPSILTWSNPKETGLLLGQLLLLWTVLSSTFTLRLFLRLSYWVVGALSFAEFASRKLQNSKTGVVSSYRPSRFLRIEDKKIDAFAQQVAGSIRKGYSGIEHVVDARDPTKGFSLSAVFWLSYKLLGAFSLKALFLFAIVALFSLPRLYLEFQEPIDNSIEEARKQVSEHVAKGKKLAHEKAGPQIEMVQKLVGTHRDRGGFPSNNGQGVSPLKEVPGSAATNPSATTTGSAAPDSVPTFVGKVNLDTEEAKAFAAAAVNDDAHPQN